MGKNPTKCKEIKLEKWIKIEHRQWIELIFRLFR